MTDPDLQVELRHLRAQILRAREDLALERELAYAQSEIATLRKKGPTTVRQAAAPGEFRPRVTDPLERLFCGTAARLTGGRADGSPGVVRTESFGRKWRVSC